MIANVGAVAGLAWAVVLAVVLVGRRRPAVVVAMGGYASVPPALAAALWGVPVVLVNVDAVPGAANRLVGTLRPGRGGGLPGTELPRAVVTGAPVRPEIVAVAGTRDDATGRSARLALGLPANRFGGGGGGRVARCQDDQRGGGRARGSCGPIVTTWPSTTWWAAQRAALAGGAPRSTGGLSTRQVAYENRMPLFYQAADVVVARAGANTVAELTVVGVPFGAGPAARCPGGPPDGQRPGSRTSRRRRA